MLKLRIVKIVNGNGEISYEVQRRRWFIWTSLWYPRTLEEAKENLDLEVSWYNKRRVASETVITSEERE